MPARLTTVDRQSQMPWVSGLRMSILRNWAAELGGGMGQRG